MGFFNYISKTYHRNLLEKLLIKRKNLISGRILDIGSKYRRYDDLFEGEITAIDIMPNLKLNVIKGDLINLQFNSNSFDSVLCLEVFQYLNPEDFKKGFEEIYRVLKEKGKAIITIPFYYIDHEDNIRFTFTYVKNYLNKLDKFEFKIVKIGNKYTTLYDVKRYSKKTPDSLKLKFLGKNLTLFILYLLINLFSLESVKDKFYSGLFIILTKI